MSSRHCVPQQGDSQRPMEMMSRGWKSQPEDAAIHRRWGVNIMENSARNELKHLKCKNP